MTRPSEITIGKTYRIQSTKLWTVIDITTYGTVHIRSEHGSITDHVDIQKFAESVVEEVRDSKRLPQWFKDWRLRRKLRALTHRKSETR